MTTTGPDGHVHRYLIIGAGPGGVQLSYYLQRTGADYLTLEREDAPGAFFRRYPRHRKLISLNKVNIGQKDPEIALRWDWNSLLNDNPDLLFPQYSREYFPRADDLVRYLADFQREHDLNVRYSTAVERIEKVDGLFTVHAGGEVFRAECVIMAAGWGGPFIPDIPGIELATGYEDMSCSGEQYTGKRVLVIGKGNSAFETAHAMLGHASVIHLASPHAVRFAWDTKHPGHVRGQYGALLDSYWFKTLDGVLECEIDRIWSEGDCFKAEITYTLAQGEKAVLEYDHVVRCTGFRMDTSVFDESCMPEMGFGGRLPVIRPDFQSQNVDGLYFAGTLMQGRDFKGASSAFIDGFRYNLRTLTALLAERYENTPLDSQVLRADPDELTATILERLNYSSALWTQFEYLCDVYVVDRDTGEVRHYIDLPEDYAVQRFADEPFVLTATLRWGPRDQADVFNIVRHPTPDRAHESAFLHPVVRAWHNGEQVAEQHLLEDLAAEWRDQVRHVQPLCKFLAAQLGVETARP
ncbi:NAD(P)-binding domain-containing protein [Sphaerisporangium sp. TRM90804]|uniref:NAD(P)-binding domain-containing protein n=1 Tax=Sphaerisporangium sp. TRM90804 TaxID=3031113 RepID=UPI00244848D5|nr:NAD(P)-binding domain-containing protein [Sphaerisporangium sp. TRM90804]MDH2429392.1 NAD(P)-binding domain-containing protein [Sphaerisporangium sp. TRM90804]